MVNEWSCTSCLWRAEGKLCLAHDGELNLCAASDAELTAAQDVYVARRTDAAVLKFWRKTVAFSLLVSRSQNGKDRTINDFRNLSTFRRRCFRLYLCSAEF